MNEKDKKDLLKLIDGMENYFDLRQKGLLESYKKEVTPAKYTSIIMSAILAVGLITSSAGFIPLVLAFSAIPAMNISKWITLRNSYKYKKESLINAKKHCQKLKKSKVNISEKNINSRAVNRQKASSKKAALQKEIKNTKKGFLSKVITATCVAGALLASTTGIVIPAVLVGVSTVVAHRKNKKIANLTNGITDCDQYITQLNNKDTYVNKIRDIHEKKRLAELKKQEEAEEAKKEKEKENAVEAKKQSAEQIKVNDPSIAQASQITHSDLKDMESVFTPESKGVSNSTPKKI